MDSVYFYTFFFFLIFDKFVVSVNLVNCVMLLMEFKKVLRM